jgi:hypothetical protein
MPVTTWLTTTACPEALAAASRASTGRVCRQSANGGMTLT